MLKRFKTFPRIIFKRTVNPLLVMIVNEIYKYNSQRLLKTKGCFIYTYITEIHETCSLIFPMEEDSSTIILIW